MLPEWIAKRISPEPMSGCWLWIGTVHGPGYGTLTLYDSPCGKKTVLAHRAVYEALRGPIPNGLCLDHLCRTITCVNPDHLEPVTWRENILRGVGPTAKHSQQTHCIRGHEFGIDNHGKRLCFTCTSYDGRKKLGTLTRSTRCASYHRGIRCGLKRGHAGSHSVNKFGFIVDWPRLRMRRITLNQKVGA